VVLAKRQHRKMVAMAPQQQEAAMMSTRTIIEAVYLPTATLIFEESLATVAVCADVRKSVGKTDGVAVGLKFGAKDGCVRRVK